MQLASWVHKRHTGIRQAAVSQANAHRLAKASPVLLGRLVLHMVHDSQPRPALGLVHLCQAVIQQLQLRYGSFLACILDPAQHQRYAQYAGYGCRIAYTQPLQSKGALMQPAQCRLHTGSVVYGKQDSAESKPVVSPCCKALTACAPCTGRQGHTCPLSCPRSRSALVQRLWSLPLTSQAAHQASSPSGGSQGYINVQLTCLSSCRSGEAGVLRRPGRKQR